MESPQIDLMGVKIDDVTMDEAVSKIDALVDARKPVYVVTPNVDHVVKLQRDAEFRRIYAGAAVVLADGMPLLWAGRFLGTPLKEKISGSDLFPKLCARAAEKGRSIFLLGGRPGAADTAAQVLAVRHPGLKIAGTYCPPMGFEKDPAESAKIVRRLKESRADLLFVGLGAPKQERWMATFKDDHGIPVSVGVGVTFEFTAGMVKRAPAWMQRAGLEWLWRLLMEPGRLWKRYLIDDMPFFWMMLRHKLKGAPA
jgi:N-acetylglucosaminyldiphosphoundecaprenol N-acetyl-beta-D-mannosaminyltransferase